MVRRIKVVNVAVIRDRSLLLVYKGRAWMLPGGKPENGESDEVCLQREVEEELSGTKIDRCSLRYYGKFVGLTPHSKKKAGVEVYSANLDGKLGAPSREITDWTWVGVENVGNYRLSDITSKIFKSFQIDGYL